MPIQIIDMPLIDKREPKCPLCKTTSCEHSWVLVDIVDGEIQGWQGGGEWWSADFESYINEGYDIEHFCTETPEIETRMKEKRTFWVFFDKVSSYYDPPHWNLDYGLDVGESGIEYGKYAILDQLP